MNFQYRATAWVAVRILADVEASLPWGLSGKTTIEWLRCETEQPVDDLMVGTSRNGLVLPQIMHTLQLSLKPDSPLASALDQCVRQFIAQRTGVPGKHPWERPLNPQQDRLGLITSSGSSAPIRLHLPTALNRLHHLVDGQTLDEAAANSSERDALSAVLSHAKRSWQAVLAVPPRTKKFGNSSCCSASTCWTSMLAALTSTRRRTGCAPQFYVPLHTLTPLGPG
jgi:hypothetical protein